ncbi:MAG: cob(I)yrinic acid a,c-diamide adenosyltransferase [Zhaonellaceae bacterium]
MEEKILFTIQNPLAEDYELAREAFEVAQRKERDDTVNVMILDELNVALYYKLLDLNLVLDFLHNKRKDVEIVITGRYAPPEIVKIAHLVTEMIEIKHPYHGGVRARKGIEY